MQLDFRRLLEVFFVMAIMMCGFGSLGFGVWVWGLGRWCGSLAGGWGTLQTLMLTKPSTKDRMNVSINSTKKLANNAMG